MLRTWVWAASIITVRLILMASADVITNMGDFYATLSCSETFDGYAL